MAKARSRTVARKMKDKWKAKTWYNVLAPPSFDNVTIADTLADKPANLINRVTEVSLQELTNDFRKSHIKLYFKIHSVEETNAHTQFVGHTLTSDYLRRMIRRKRSKIDGVYDATTRDGATIRVKPFATTDKRIQNSQRKIVRETMKKTILDQAKVSTLSEFVKSIIDGKIGSDIYKNCKKLYPVKRVEVYKTQVLSPPTIEIEEEKPAIVEQPEAKETEEKGKETPKKEEKKSEEKTKSVEELFKEEEKSPEELPQKEEQSVEPKEEKPEELESPVEPKEEPKEEKPEELESPVEPKEEPKEEKPEELESPVEPKEEPKEEKPEELESPVEPEEEIKETEPEEPVEPKEEPKEEKPEKKHGDEDKVKKQDKKTTKKTTAKKAKKATK
jgi:small subunit ribosomal protein S3Ae